MSVHTSESLVASQSTLESMNSATSEAVSTAQSEYDSLLEKYNDSEQRLQRLAELKKLIDAQRVVVEGKRQEALDRKDKNLDKVGYYQEADKLANLLIQYKMLTDAQVKNYTDVKFTGWEDHDKGVDVDGKYVTVTYKYECF